MQEKGEEYSRYILGVVRISTWEPTYSPYIFLNASEENGEADHIHFNYYKDTRSTGGSLKQGHGPGGAPVLGKKEMLDLIATLIKSGFLNKTELRECLDRTP